MSDAASPKDFFAELRKKKIVEILAAFVGGGWLILEFVHWILVDHYHFPEKTIDITFVTILGALLATLAWRWFSGSSKSGKFKIELVLIPLVILVTVGLDIGILLRKEAAEPESSPASPWKNSIAVLPFEDMSPQKDQEYFCDGMTEELINRLSHIRELKVPARTSVFTFKGKAEDIRDIGRKLDVRTVLEGSIRKSGDQLRVTAQLINIADGFLLWSETYDREFKDVFKTWDEIALTIADKLEFTLLAEERAKVTKRYTEKLEPYNLYLKGRWHWNKWTEPEIRKSIEYFQQAIAVDPGYALAYAGLAQAYETLSHYSIVRPEEIYPKAKELALRALALDNTLAEAHVVLAYISVYYDWDWEAGEREFKAAIALKPDDVTAHHTYSYFLVILNRFDEAFTEIRKALALDPLNLITNRTIGDFYYHSGQYDQAIESLKRTIEMDPSFSYAHSYLGLSYLQKSMYPEAIEEIKKDLAMQTALEPMLLADLGAAYAKAGSVEKANDILNRLLAESQNKYIPPYFFSYLYVALGDLDRGFEYLDKAYRGRDVWLPLLTFDHLLDPARSDPRFAKILKRMRLR
jgi:adenylate cyclase